MRVSKLLILFWLIVCAASQISLAAQTLDDGYMILRVQYKVGNDGIREELTLEKESDNQESSLKQGPDGQIIEMTEDGGQTMLNREVNVLNSLHRKGWRVVSTEIFEMGSRTYRQYLLEHVVQ